MKKIYLFLFIPLLLTACKKETQVVTTQVVDNVIYQVGGTAVYQDNSEKNKEKSNTQYISILHANLFQTSISPSDLTDLSEIRTAIGDKAVADELILNSYVNSPTVQIPTNQQMRNDIDQFVEDTYLRFFLRLPNAYERHYLKTSIENDTQLTPELIYTAFSLSNEYKYY